ncbi:hypothetical protein ACI78V_19765 [Geodermatophilus sp. SYSU D00742]
MRTPASLVRSVVAGAVAVLLLTACGGSGEDEPAASSSAPSSSSAPTTSGPAQSPAADPAVAGFCSQVTSAFATFSSLQTATPVELAGNLPQIVSTLEQVQPPAEITGDWETFVGSLRQLRATAATLDLDTPEGQQQFAQAEQQLIQGLGAAQTNLLGYISANCGLGGAAPTG